MADGSEFHSVPPYRLWDRVDTSGTAGAGRGEAVLRG
jgi:hypothetical protein